MLLRHKLDNEWEKYLPDVVYNLNHSYIYGSNSITPSKAQKNQAKYDVKIRDLKQAKGGYFPNTLKQQEIQRNKYLRSRQSSQKRPGDFVWLRYGFSPMTKSVDYQVTICLIYDIAFD